MTVSPKNPVLVINSPPERKLECSGEFPWRFSVLSMGKAIYRIGGMRLTGVPGPVPANSVASEFQFR